MTQPLKPRGNASRGGYLCGHCVFFMLYFEARWVPGSRLIPGLGLGLRPGTLTLGPEREVGAVTPPPTCRAPRFEVQPSQPQRPYASSLEPQI